MISNLGFDFLRRALLGSGSTLYYISGKKGEKSLYISCVVLQKSLKKINYGFDCFLRNRLNFEVRFLLALFKIGTWY